MARIVVLGAGVMGSAMAMPAASAGHSIALVGTNLDDAIIRSVGGNGLHPRLGLNMPEAVTAHYHAELTAVLAAGADLLVLGVSSAGVAWALDRLAESLRAPIPILIITKGVAPKDGRLEVLPVFVASEVARRTGFSVPVMAIGGPCIAGELAALRHTSVVITGGDPAEIEKTIGLLNAPFYHARPSDDVIGVEICAAFKNFYALGVGAAAGILEREGKGANGALMYNLASSAFAQALAELAILVTAVGGSTRSVYGLPGVGDLHVTCQAGRNSRMGRLLGLGLTYAQAKREHMAADTVEGAQLAIDLGDTLKTMFSENLLPAARMPLTRAILACVCDGAPLTLDFDDFHHA